MTARTLLSCATAGIFTLASIHAAPQFQSLTPGSQPSSSSSKWVKHLNDMNEAERQRRVQTYGMPPAPPNRWAKRVTAQPRVQPTPRRQSAPQSLYQNRPKVVSAKVQPLRQAQLIRYTPPTRQAQPVRQTQPVRQAQAQAQPASYSPPAKRSRLISWKPIQLKKKPRPVTRQESLRQQVAFMPTNSTQLPQTNPYAPYNSRAEYDQAIRRSKWLPRARSAKMLAEQSRRSTQAKPKKRWSIGSIFKRKKNAAPGAKPQKRSSKRSPATRSNTTPRVPNSTYVTSGLPQSNNDSGSMIETTLFGN